MTLVERLAEKLNVPLEEADRRLDQFVTDVQRHLDEDGEVDLPGIGTFRRSADGEVEFTATPSLAAVANYRFGGLSPVRMPGEEHSGDEINPGETEVDEPAHNATVDTGDEEDEGMAPEAKAAEQPASDPAEPKRPGTVDETVDEEVEQFWDEERGESPLGSLPDEGFEDTSYSVVDEASETSGKGVKSNSSQTSEKGEKSETPDAREEIPEDGDEETIPDHEDTTDDAPPQRAFPRKPRSSQNSSRRTLGVVAVLLIATGAALLMYYAWSGDSITASDSSVTPTEQTADAGAADDDTTSAAQEATAGTNQSSNGSETSGPAPFDAPMRSEEGIQPEHGGQTWVIASLADRSAAENLRDTYAANGFRTSVFKGGAGYRVAVGQFETREAALATRDQLPADVASAAWIMEIQSNMSPLVSS